jgi:hypothetical protein
MDAAPMNAHRPHAVADHRSTGARDRSARTPQRGTVHTRVNHSANAPATADRLQAGYFMRLLTQTRVRIGDRIDAYQKAISNSEASGDAEYVPGLRRMMRAEEQNRQAVEGLIENLQRRFPVRSPGEAPQIPWRARPAVRSDRIRSRGATPKASVGGEGSRG